jgi:histidine ammonia-lyase
MAPWAGLKLQQLLQNVQRILAIEALAAAEAIDLQRPLKTTAELEPVHAWIRRQAPAGQGDRRLDRDIAALASALEARTLLNELAPFLLPLGHY